MPNWLSMALLAMTKLPLEKMIIRKRDPVESVKKLEALLAKGNTESSPRALAEPSLPQDMSESEGAKEVKRGGVSTEETIAYQKREIGKEMLLLEKHLQQRCKIGGKACDCCEKHPLAIEALAQEALGMTDDPLYTKVVDWARSISPKTTEEASISGDYDEEYPKLAVEARSMRKQLMGTADVKALLGPELSEKVKEEVHEILDQALKEKGGDDGDREQKGV